MIVALVVACALFMETFTGTVITTALPDMARSFGANPVELSLAVTSYMLSLAVFIPVSGWVADRYGARTIFRIAIGVFTVASVLCGISNDVMELTGARILQGIGGAMMVPVGRLVLLRTVERSEYVRAMAVLTVPAFMGPVVGPPVGGFVTTYFSWRWIFFLNVPIGILGMVLVTLYIKNYKEPYSPPLDWIGFILTGVSLSCLIYGLDLAARPSADQGYGTLPLILLGVLCGIVAVLHSRRYPTPLIDLSLLSIPTFRAGVWSGVTFRIGAGAQPFLLPILLQVGFGMTAFESGLITFGDAIGALVMNALAPPILRRFGFRTVLIGNGIISGLCVMGCGAFTALTPSIAMFVFLVVTGFIKSLQYNSFGTIVYADVPARNMSAATSLASMVQQLCNGLGIAFGALVLQLVLSLRGVSPEALTATDVRYVFLTAGVLALSSVYFYFSLAPDAGVELSGHRIGRGKEPPRES